MTSGRGRSGPRDRGSFTAELAVAMPGLLLLMFVGLTAVSATVVKLRCVDAARDAALAAARGEPVTGAGAPDGGSVTVIPEGELVRVIVRAPVPALGARLPGLTVEATAVAAVEPGTAGAGP